MTAWTDLVKKVYAENKHKSGYTLGLAMKDASLRKGEMKTTSKSANSKSKKTKKYRKSNKKKKTAGGKRTRSHKRTRIRPRSRSFA